MVALICLPIIVYSLYRFDVGEWFLLAIFGGIFAGYYLGYGPVAILTALCLYFLWDTVRDARSGSTHSLWGLGRTVDVGMFFLGILFLIPLWTATLIGHAYGSPIDLSFFGKVLHRYILR